MAGRGGLSPGRKLRDGKREETAAAAAASGIPMWQRGRQRQRGGGPASAVLETLPPSSQPSCLPRNAPCLRILPSQLLQTPNSSLADPLSPQVHSGGSSEVSDLDT